MKLDIVPLSKIDFKDNTFLITPDVGIPSLLSSIKDVGIINQPILREKSDLNQIICGHKRLEACRELGIAEILAKVYKSDEITDEECLKIVFYENQGRFSDLERGELLLKFKILCNLNENELIKERFRF